MALVVPVLLSPALEPGWPHQRKTALAAFAITTVVLLSTYSAALVGLIAGVLILLGLRRQRFGVLASRQRSLVLPALIAGIVLVAVLLPGGSYGFERLLGPLSDPSAKGRLSAIEQGFLAFLESPFIGHGAYNRLVITSGGHRLMGHNSYIVAAYEFGLTYLVPLIILLVAIGREYARLLRRAQRPLELALARGMFASFLAAIITGFVTPVLGEPGQDAIFWLFIGIMTVWNGWLDRDPQAILVT